MQLHLLRSERRTCDRLFKVSTFDRYVVRIFKTPDVPDSYDLNRQIKIKIGTSDPSWVKYSIFSTVNLINFSNFCVP